jgi:hypothetical protein
MWTCGTNTIYELTDLRIDGFQSIRKFINALYFAGVSLSSPPLCVERAPVGRVPPGALQKKSAVWREEARRTQTPAPAYNSCR